MENNFIVDLGRKFAACKAEHDEAAKVLKDIAAKWTEVENELLQAMSEAGMKSITIEGVGRLTLRRSHYPSVNSSNKPGFFEYMKKSGHGALIKEDVNTQTLNAFLKRHVEELKLQLEEDGLTTLQADILNEKAGMDPENYGKYMGVTTGLKIDAMDAEEIALAILKSQGAAMFEKKDIALSKG